MIVKLQIVEDDLNPQGGKTKGDEVILAIDGVLNEPIWKAEGDNTWVVGSKG